MKQSVIELDTSGKLPPPGSRYNSQEYAAVSKQIDALADYIHTAFRTNYMHKLSSGIQETMLRCTRQRNGEYDPEDAPKVGKYNVYMNVTGLKCRGAEAWLQDTMINVEEQPWTITPRENPELPDYLKDQIVDLVKREVIARGYADTALLEQRVKELKDAAHQQAVQLATAACDRMTRKISDQMTDAEWQTHFEEWQSDIVTYPSGVLKGPVIRNMRKLQWNGNKLDVVIKTGFAFERVSPLDLYPSPEATTVNDASNVIEHMRLTKQQLYECIGVPYFDEEAVRVVIREYEEGYKNWLTTDGERAASEKKEGMLWGTDYTLDVLDFWGRVEGRLLKEWGVEGIDDEDAQYECNAWLVGDYVIRALLNPDKMGRRPYNVASFNRLPGQFWGQGIPQLIRDIQRSVNAASRSLIRNMTYSAGPVAEMDLNRLEEGDTRITEIEPYKVYFTKANTMPGQGSAIRFIEVPSIIPDLVNIVNDYLSKADDYSGIPSYTYGDMSQAANAPMGSLSLLFGNASKTIKRVITNMDRYGIQPIIQQIYDWNMLYDPDQSIKADADVVTRGAEGILQKEQAQARSIEALQVVTPYVQGGLVPRAAAQMLIQQWLQQNGWDVSQFFPDNAINQEIANTLGPLPASANTTPQPSMQPGTPPPPLDGRQASVQQVMQQSQIPAA